VSTGRILAALLLASPCFVGSVHAFDPERPVALYVRERWGVEDGFPGGVHAITQGVEGQLWIGTENGLVRFDGREFVMNPRTDRGPRELASVLGAVVDRAGSLWVRRDGPALLRIGQGRSADVRLGADAREVAVTAMTLLRSGNLLVCGQASGLLTWKAGRFERLEVAPSPGSIVLALAETAEGRLLLGTRDAGLFLLENGRLRALATGLPDRKVNAVLAVDAGEAWIGTDRGLVHWDGRGLTTAGVPESLRDVQVLALLRDRDGLLWVGTNGGLVRVNRKGAAEPAGATGLAVTALFEDREGDLWVGSGGGIERLHDPVFTSYSRAEDGSREGVGPILADRGDRIWFATSEGRLRRLHDGRAEAVPLPGARGDRVYSMAEGSSGIWVGLRSGGLLRLSSTGRVLQALPIGRREQARDGIVALDEGRDGTVWAGTLNAGLWSWRRGLLEHFTVENGLPSNSIGALLESHDGTLFVGTAAGLVERSLGGWTTRRARDGLPSDNVTALLEDAARVLWIGTSKGLAYLESGRLKKPGGPAAPRDPVLGIAEREGWLWLSTAGGVLRVRRQALLEGTLHESDVRVYGRQDGLQGTRGARGHRTVVADARGRVWFATNRGLAVVSPRRALASPPPPVVQVRSLAADERDIALVGAVRVPPLPRRLRLTYSAIRLRGPEAVRYRHRLEGFDADWSEAASVGEATYANLGPGEYRFRVAAAGPDGGWSTNDAVLRFAIAPAPWQTAWFRLAVVLAAVVVVWLLYRWWLERVTRRLNAAFEVRLAERTRIARDLHDTLLQGFISASMQLHVALQQVDEGSPARGLLARLQHLVGEVVEQGRSTVQGLRAAEPDPGDLAQAFSRVGEDVQTGDGAEVRVIVEGAPRALHPAVHDELYRIGREALVNALRHARASRVEVEIDYAPRSLRLLVRDDGVGVDADVLRLGRDGHYGLSGMRERAERIGGQLRLWSAPGAGTEVEVAVRAGVAFASSPSSRRRGWVERLRGVVSWPRTPGNVGRGGAET
jgi:signal transduction histidine kinase/ligand-binding sensor domain-containing protein